MNKCYHVNGAGLDPCVHMVEERTRKDIAYHIKETCSAISTTGFLCVRCEELATYALGEWK